MDSGIKIFWPNYKVGTRSNFQPGNGLRKSNPDFSPRETSKLTLKCSQNPAFPWSGIVEEFCSFRLCGLARDVKHWTRQTLTLTDVLNGSVICMDKQTITITNNTNEEPKYAVQQSSEIASVGRLKSYWVIASGTLPVTTEMREDNCSVSANICIHNFLRDT